MELTYMVRGLDGKEYGPATIEQLSAWAKEGRLPSTQEVKRSDLDYWARAGDFQELQPVLTAVTAPVNTPGVIQTKPATIAANPAALAQMRSGASWFYWIAGLSLINSIAAFSGTSWRFILGLGITQVFDSFGATMGGSGRFIVLLLDLLAAGFFIMLGFFGHKAHLWSFILGMILFALDGLIFLLVKDWLGVGFHAFVVYCLFRGCDGCRKVRA
jgi:GYF domain 2